MIVERKLLPIGDFLEYVRSGKAIAVDLVIRDPKSRIYLERRVDGFLGMALPGTVKLPGEQSDKLILYVAQKECGIEPELEKVESTFLGTVRDDDLERDPRGKMGHEVYEIHVGFESLIMQKCDGAAADFYSDLPLDLIPAHKKILRELCGMKI